MLVEGGNFDLLSKPHIVGELHPDVIGCGFVEDLPWIDIYPLSSARRQKITGLTSCYEQRRCILFRACTDQERATAASLRVAWILGKKKEEKARLRDSQGV